MGLLDSLFASQQSGGLLGGLPASWQYQNPEKKLQEDEFMRAIRGNPTEGIGAPPAPNPFGPVPQPAPATSPFASGAAPMIGVMQDGSMPPQAQPNQSPQPPQPALAQQAPAQSPQPGPAPAPQNGPINNMSVGGYQMPQFGNVSDYTPTDSLPRNAQATNGQTLTDFSSQTRQPAPQEELPPALGGGNYLQRVLNGGGLVRSMFDSPQQQNASAQYKAVMQTLIENGETQKAASSKAMLAVMNPEAGKTILNEALTNKEKYQVTGEDALGNKQYGFVNDRDQTINGKKMGEGGGSNGGGGMGFLAPGVKQIDSQLTGKDYLGQFSPEIQAGVKDYIDGKSLPTGNPRKGFTQAIKMIAQKYGADIGQPADDNNFAEKKKYRTELGSTSANTAGGQAKAFNQGIDHLTSLADKMEKLDNSNGFGIPMIAGAVNSVRQGFSTDQSAISDEAKSLGQTVAGEVGKLFSGSAGGGVHERELTRERFDTVKSKPQMAAALRATIETMQGGLHALEARRDQTLGPNNGHEFIDQKTRANIEKIQGVIDRLEGNTSKRPAPTSIPSGWSVKAR